MGDRAEWERLCKVLRDIQVVNDPVHTEQVLACVLVAVRDRLRDLTFTYVVPARVSFLQAHDLVHKFLKERSGGDRGLAITAALFEAFKGRFNIYTEIRRNVINAADTATNSAGDLECLGPNGRIVLAVEVKERQIEATDVTGALAKVRERGVTEILLCTEGMSPRDRTEVERIFQTAWASGTNLYHATIGDLMRASLPLIGEQGIRDFVAQIGRQLDRFSTQPRHRKAWKSLLDDL
jgi:hypothetical protein